MARLTLNVMNQTPVLGSFGKGIEGSYSLNYGQSSGKNCDKSCPHHYQSTAENATNACYATRSETYRLALKNRLQRHEKCGAYQITRKAIREIQHLIDTGHKPKWLRFSVAGSVPQPEDVTVPFRKALRELLDLCEANEIPVHFPVETNRKARFYRRIVGGRCVIRESTHDEQAFVLTGGQTSFVGGTSEMSKKERLEDSKRLATLRTEATGRKAIVCPAVATKYYAYDRARAAGKTHQEAQKETGSPLAKCGSCTCCADATKDIIYPLH
jgi:O-acetyl-ADP-ribose deacetylase (regulator of RNase III)